jgi:hypothetical protein
MLVNFAEPILKGCFVNTTADPLVAYLKALPFHSQDKKTKNNLLEFR